MKCGKGLPLVTLRAFLACGATASAKKVTNSRQLVLSVVNPVFFGSLQRGRDVGLGDYGVE